MGERETRTVLFTDIVGSTRLRTTFGDDAVDALVAEHDAAVHAAVAESGGAVVKGTGDGTLALFGSARAAVNAAVRMQQTFASAAVRDGPPLRVRVALHAGEVRNVAGDVLGEAVNAAARILDHTGGGEIVVSRVVRDLSGSLQVELLDRGDHDLRGFSEPQRLYGVEWSTPATATDLEVRLLGEPALTVGGRPIDGFASSRMQRLLALLVLEAGAPIPRTRLAFRLWPDSTESQSRTNLRKLLHQLRHEVPSIETAVSIDQQHVRWRTDSAARVDLIELQRAISTGDDERTVALYGGDLLPDCYDDWVIASREQLRLQVGEALDRLATAAAARGDHRGVLDRAGARLRLDPAWEPAFQLLMRSHAALGNRAEALRLYHRCAQLLREELGVDPDPLTKEIYDQVRGQTSAGARQGQLQDVELVGPPDLVGRDRELARLRTIWQDAQGGRARLVVVSGEAGIGKSRLVDELVRLVRPTATVAGARAYEAAGRLPWGPIVQWLRAEPIEAALTLLAPAWRAELALLLPELRSAAESVAVNESGVDPSTRTQLFDAVSRALMARDRPTLLALDDLQWCDKDTIDLIGYVVASQLDAPLLVAGTLRSEALADDHPLHQLMSGLARDGALAEIALDPLGREATAELAGRLTGEEIADDEVDQVWRETAGNPLFLVEAARAGWRDESGGLAMALPSAVQATIATRLGALPPDTRGVMEIAATLGRAFGSAELVAVSEHDEHVVLDALDELWRRRIVGERGTAYDFTHDRVREVAYAGISPVRRRRLHHAVARALVAAHGAAPGPHSAELAAHLEAAGEIGEAVGARLHAAEHANAVYSLDEAITSCQHGLSLLEHLPAGRHRDERELALHLALGAPLIAREGYGSVLGQRVYERSLVLCRQLGRQVDPATLRGLGLAAVTSCRFDRSARFGRELLDLDDDPIARTEGHYLLGVTGFWRGDLDMAHHHLTRAIAAYQPELGPVHRTYFAQDPEAVCTVRLALNHLWRGDVETARSMAAASRRLASTLDHPLTTTYVQLYSALIATELEDVELLRASVEAGRLLAHHDLGFFTILLAQFTGWVGVLDDDPAGLALLESSVERCRPVHESLHLTHGLGLLARALLRRGDLDRAADAVREARGWSDARDQHYLDSVLHRIDGQLCLAGGDHAAAADAFARAIDVAEAQGASFLRDSARALLDEAVAGA